jgi:hypothetical protein
MQDEDSTDIFWERCNFHKILVALVLTRTIVQPYFNLIQNPPTVMLELPRVRLNNVFETGIMKNVILFLPFQDRIAKEIPDITIVDSMPNILSFLLHSNELRGMAHHKYCEHSVRILGAVAKFGGMQITSCREVGEDEQLVS